ncbi:HD-like signal output (HDOD) domain, no enzymatic activity [Duganella sp. CF402]|uniref:HDOD domain-containing protein n=1 Tax=unclassified Duganella TaxID=2636909 RepID=UPI0008BBD883|nr:MULTISPECIES: HDOD domain-containing protein [unclassified Duganella]RZT10666.1 HD-like signal output (HDOD) protein [Duganella sp. BK701]SEL03129.1 HD-like signal output (HDOD) domain, no enzymatic activity [Duganella sp. CF402]
MIRSYQAATPLGNQTLSELGDCTRRRGDMPGFAKAITAILSAMRGEDDQEFNMTRTVLSDPVLTQKVLRLANSGMYSAFGQHVNTVSKAVLVLGTEAIGHLALGLKLIEELAATSTDTTIAHIEMEKAVLAGIVAQQIAYTAESRHGEEAVVCSMLHTLGRMMLTFYMPERWHDLQRLADQTSRSVEDAAPELLGLSLEEVGHAAALHWGLPAALLNGMRTLAPAAPGTEISPSDWIAGLSTMASRCAESLWHDDAAGAERVQQLAESYAGMLGVEAPNLMNAIEQAKVVAANDLTIAPLSRPAERRAKALAKTRQRAAGNKILLSGLADMRDVLDTASPGQMVQIALETVYKGLDFSRAVAFVRNRKDATYSAKISFGEGTRELLPAMTFDDAYEPNVFHAALNSDRVIFIENAHDAKFAAKLPLWWKSSLSEARSFVILPLSANGQPAGFLYGDWDDSFPPISLSATEFSLLNDMRAMVVRAVERRHGVAPEAVSR